MIKISIRYKLLLSFILISLLILSVSIYTISRINYIKQEILTIIEDAFPRFQALLEMKNSSHIVNAFIANLPEEIDSATPNSNTPTKIGAAKDKLLSYLGDVEDWQNIYSSHFAKNTKSTLDNKKVNKLQDIVTLAALDVFKATESKQSEAVLIAKRAILYRAQTNLNDLIDNAVAAESLALDLKKENAVNSVNQIYRNALILNILIIVISIGLSLLLTRLISRPIIYLKNFATSISQNNLDKHAEIMTNDETGDLARNINSMLETLSTAKGQLIQASRAAGISEVATSILHNIGNVLNSMNVSILLLRETIENTKSSDLNKISDLLELNKPKIQDYLNHDEQGKNILPYMKALSMQLGKERFIIKEQLARLTNNLQHISNVIAMQQSYGRSGGVKESIEISALIDSTLDILKNKIKQSNIEIEIINIDISPIVSVKAKLEQILINLIKNAIEATAASENKHKKILIKYEKLVNDFIQITVKDNGVGVLPENLNKIFTFGFTTKSGGHGYGLHNSALLANELGGSLVMEANGLDSGSTFKLELPS